MRRGKQRNNAQAMLFGADVVAPYADEMYSPSRITLESADENWCSCEEVLAPVRLMGPIVFDPFSNPFSLVGALRACMLPGEDSLRIDWPLDGLIYCNPPYGRALGACAEKIAQQAKRGCEIITCVPVRVDTEWWRLGLKPSLWCAWAGRLYFLETPAALEARWAARCEAAKQQNRQAPPKPKYKMVSEHLAKGESATFASAVCYAGQRRDEFMHRFAKHGELYQRVALAA